MPYKYSPIQDKETLLEAIKYLHIQCNKLCKQIFGKYLPTAGNIGVFSHFGDEYKFLIELRKNITSEKNWNQKYYFLQEPIIIPEELGIPGATYTYLYIRKPDPGRPEVGDIDFVLSGKEFLKFRNLSGQTVNNVEILYRPDLDMLRLSNTNFDVLPYITTITMEQKGI